MPLSEMRETHLPYYAPTGPAPTIRGTGNNLIQQLEMDNTGLHLHLL